ncbi:MAG: FxsA family protein [Planctomycetota bacterium]
MLLRLLLLFIIVPLVELYLLLQLANLTSVGATFLLVLVTGIIGSWLARREGVMAWQKFHAALGEGRMPSQEIQDGLMIIFAAALLLTPGLLTDLVGFTLLIPAGRNVVRKLILPRFFKGFGSVQIQTTTFEGFGEGYQSRSTFDDGTTLEGKATKRQ